MSGGENEKVGERNKIVREEVSFKRYRLSKKKNENSYPDTRRETFVDIPDKRRKRVSATT